jgi:hypothetical protein
MHAIFRTKRAHDVRIKGGARACMPASGRVAALLRVGLVTWASGFVRSYRASGRHGHVGVVDLLMTEAPHLSSVPTEDGTSPLYLAAMAGSAQMVPWNGLLCMSRRHLAVVRSFTSTASIHNSASSFPS